MTTADSSSTDARSTYDIEWNAGNMSCGELLLKLRVRLRKMPGQIIRLVTLDRGAIEDIPSFCRITGHRLLHSEPTQGVFFIKAKD